MTLLLCFLSIVVFLRTFTAAYPNDAASDAKFQRFTATFDDVGYPIPDDYAGSFWSSSFYPTEPLSSDNNWGISPHSGSSVAAVYGPEGNTIATSGRVLIQTLRSFSFACVGNIGLDPNSLVPTACQIMVTSVSVDKVIGYEHRGPWTFSPNYTLWYQGLPSPMKRVVLGDGGMPGSTFYFQIAAGPPSTVFMLDDVVLLQ